MLLTARITPDVMFCCLQSNAKRYLYLSISVYVGLIQHALTLRILHRQQPEMFTSEYYSHVIHNTVI